MLCETQDNFPGEDRDELRELDELDDAANANRREVPVVAALPASVVMSQRCAGVLRAYLERAKLAHYRIFFAADHELWDVERHLAALNEPAAAWEAAPPLVGGGEPLHHVTSTPQASHVWESGLIRLARHEVVLAKWWWIDTDEGTNANRSIWLAAAPSPEAYHRLRTALQAIRRSSVTAVWQIVSGYAHGDLPTAPRVALTDLLLSDAVAQRVQREIVGFFAPAVAELYRSLMVPYRRGVLLHGPPGNGKTILIRHVGAQLPNVPAMLLRPAAAFDADDFEEVVRRWKRQAPAILVIEDLNWLLEQVNVSAFLNALDGADAQLTGGLLLIATTNYPERLDPAITNRPGRFDVSLEIPCPDAALRLAFLRQKLGGGDVSGAVIDRAADEADRLSFAHLQEIVRLSGLSAIHGGRTRRIDDDVLSAARMVRDAHEDAVRGFPARRPELPFGLLPLKQARK